MAFDDAVLADNPVAFWSLDETTGTVANDLTGNGHNGTYTGSPTLAGATIHGRSCPVFDGVDDYVALSVLNIAPGGTYTVEAVARADVIVAGSEVISEAYTAGSDGVHASIGIRIGTATTPGVITAGSYSGGEGSPPWTWHVLEHEPWTAGDAHHLVYTHDGTTARFYVDGDLVDSTGFAAFGSFSPWSIGRKYDGTLYWTGAIAGVALYSTALTATQIADHYDALVPAGPVVVEAAVAFTATATTSFAPATETSTAAVAFTANATLTATAEVAVATGAISFRVTGTLDVLARPVGRRRRLVVTDIYGTPYGELENANLGAITFSLNEPEAFAFTLPLSDPKARLLLDEPMREVMVFRGDQLLAWGPVVRPSADKTNLAAQAKGCLWYLTRRTIGRAARNNYVTNGDFENGLAGWETGALAPMEPLANRSGAYWSAAVTTDRTLTGSHSLRLTQSGPGVPKYGVSASQWFGWSIDPAERPEGDEWTFVARCFIPSDTWIAPPPDGVGIRVSRYSTTRTVAIRRDDGGPEILYPAPIESATATIDENTPRDVWTRLDVALHSPVTGEAEFVQVTLGCPVGTIYWDRAALTVDEGLRFYGVDQSDIVTDIVEHLQDPAYGKSDLNLVADSPATGVIRSRTYLFDEHIVGYDALADFADLDSGFDLSVALTPTTRTIRVDHPGCGGYRPSCALELGRNIADYAWTWDGENAASQVIVLGTGNGSDREEVSVTADAFAGGLTLETVYSAPPDTPIDSLDDLAVETLKATVNPQVLTVTTTAALPGQRDPVGVLWPGDYIPVRIRSGPLQVEDIYRVVELTLNPDDTLELVLNRRVEP